jgi:Fructose-2,6-bisphosphatase
MNLLYLFRHGETASPGMLVGRRDVPLSSSGEEQARQWGLRLQSVPFSAAWCSPLQRAGLTASLILQGNRGGLPGAEAVAGFTEISLGEWEGMNKAEAMRLYPDIWEKRGRDFARVAPPGGESLEELSGRILPVFRRICSMAAKHPYSLVVAHQAVNRAIIAAVKGMPLSRIQEIPQPHCALTVFAVNEQGEAKIVDEPRPTDSGSSHG